MFSVESRAAGRLAQSLGEIPSYQGGMIFKDEVSWLPRYGMTTDTLTDERVFELVERIKKAEAMTSLLLLEISEQPSAEEQKTLPCWLAVAGSKGVMIEKKALRGTPRRQSESATAFALDLLRRYLHLPLEISED